MEATAPANNGRDRHRSKPKDKTGERFAVLNAFVDFALSELTRAEIVVWLVLYRDTREGTARTSYDGIAERAGLNRRNVGRAVRRLERRGLVKVVHRGGFRRGVSRYRVRGQPKDS
jgi:DNA-binding MarR family transcriptional regulator